MPLIFLIALAILSSLAFAQEDAEMPDPSLALIMDFDEPYSPVSFVEMQRELEAILRASSLHLQWRLLDENVTKETFSNIVVARFRGSCRNEENIPPPPSSALGLTHISEGDILPFSEVNCDRVRSFVHPRLEHESNLRYEQLLGRALGRVLAHELYHVLAKTKRHARNGIAKALLKANELIDGRLEFETHELETIGRRFGRPTQLSRSSSTRM